MVRGISNILSGANSTQQAIRKAKYLSQDTREIVETVAAGWNRGVNTVQSKLRSMIQKLEETYQKEIKTLNFGGKDTEFVIYKGSKTTGANSGYFARIKGTDKLYMIKYGEEQQMRSEQLANELYELGGIKTAKQTIVSEKRIIPPKNQYHLPKQEIRFGTASEFISVDSLPTAEYAPQIREGFGMDCWLANWDALKRGNIVLSDGKIVRLDNGGALCYRARGGRKTGLEFGENVNELRTFFENYSLSKPYLKDMTRNELISSLDRVCKIPDSKIKETIKKSACFEEGRFLYDSKTGKYGCTGEKIKSPTGIENPYYLAEVLLARKNYIQRFKTQCLVTPQRTGESIADYIKRVDQNVSKTTYSVPFEKLKMSTRVRKGNLTMGEALTPSQKRLFEESSKAFKESFHNIIHHPNANNVLTTDNMLHVTSIDALDNILRKGITLSETRGSLGNGTGMETLTPLCADFWEITENTSIKSYFSKPSYKFNPGELNFLPCTSNNRRGIVIVADKKSVNPTIMKNSLLVREQHKSILSRDHNIDGHTEYITHRAIPIGISPNAFDRIIIRKDLLSQSEVNRIINMVKSRRLDIKVYDMEGNILYKGIEKAAEKTKFVSEFFNPAAKNVEDLFKKYKFRLLGKQGIPLKYSRKKFIYDINKILKDIPENQRPEFLAKFGLSKNITGDIDGIPSIKSFTPHSIREAEMVNIIERFYQNETTIQNPKAKEIFDSIIKEFPEFNMMIGKIQHATHEYSVDIHTLEVLQKAIQNPAYTVLSDESKQVLKLSILMHDFGKMGGLITRGHAEISRKYAEKILDNHNISGNIKERILNLIKNHHWFKDYNKGIMSAEDFARTFKSPEDRIIAILMAKGDFESINMDFHLTHLLSGQNLTPEQYENTFKRIIKTLQSDIFIADI